MGRTEFDGGPRGFWVEQGLRNCPPHLEDQAKFYAKVGVELGKYIDMLEAYVRIEEF